MWLAFAISLVGDWFTLIALSVLVARHSGGSGLAVGALFVVQVVPWFLFGPHAGTLADRFDRRRLLVVTDLLRAGIALLLIPASRHLPSLYALAFVHFSVSTAFEPAREALFTRLVRAEDLVPAATLDGMTWSAMLALGGLLGGTALAALGPEAAFAIDATTFLASAALLGSLRIDARPDRTDRGETRPRVREAIAWLRAHPATGAAALVKSINGLATIDTFMVLLATTVFAAGPAGLGTFYGCFGLGAVLGPLALNRFHDGSPTRLRRLIAAGSILISAAVLTLAAAPTLAAAAFGVFLRGVGGSTNWTYSSLILQKTVPDGLKGRVFGLDLAGANLSAAFAATLWGSLIDHTGLRPVMAAAAGLSVIPAVLWILLLPRLEREAPRRE